MMYLLERVGNFFYSGFILVLFAILLAAQGCDDHDNEYQHSKELLEGYSQKGPFINGSSVTLSELAADLSPTGKNFNTEIADQKGSFSLQNIILSSTYVELRVSGFYFNEVTGRNSDAPLTLDAVSDVSDKSLLNVNVLTHMEKTRVEYLVSRGTGFKEAKRQAMAEVLNIFNITKTDISSSELLDLAKEGEDNGILLAVSVIVQGTRSVADLSELLANISTDIREDGVINSQSVGVGLLSDALKLDLEIIRHNIESRYDELGITSPVSDFEKHITHFIENSSFEFSSFDVRPRATDFSDNRDSANFYIVNTGTSSIDWQINQGSETWFTFRQTSGTILGRDSAQITVIAFRDDLPKGVYDASLIVATNAGDITIDISISTLNAPTTTISAPELYIFDTSGNFQAAASSTTSDIFEVGFVWSTSPEPSLSNEHFKRPEPAFSFHQYIEGLEPNTLYYFRSYAKNHSGVGYSNSIIVKTKATYTGSESSTVTDVDGNVYPTVKIGEQWWMAENLKTTRYANGDALVNGTQVTNFEGDVTTKYYFDSPYPAPNDGQLTKYGRYYTFAAVVNEQATSNLIPSGVQGVCPTGWHVPSAAEFDILRSFIKSYGYSDHGFPYALREKGTYAAKGPTVYADPFHFNFTFGGVRGYDFGSFAVYEWNYSMWFSNMESFFGFSFKPEQGMNVRCVKD